MKKNLVLMLAVLMMGGVAIGQKAKKGAKKVEAHTGTVVSPAVEVAPVDAKVVTPQEPKQEEKKADVLWLKEVSHDFGKIPQGKPVTTEFELKNTGSDSLKLEMVQAGCGCTTPVWKAGTYAPGENFKITVGYNAAGEGAFTKPVTITYNGGQQKVINITGTVYSTPAVPAPANPTVGKIQN